MEKEVAKMMHWGDSIGMGFGFGFGWIFMVVFWAFVIMGIAYLLKQLLGSGNSGESRETALDILKKKYAAGEITKDEYGEKKTAISGKS